MQWWHVHVVTTALAKLYCFGGTEGGGGLPRSDASRLHRLPPPPPSHPHLNQSSYQNKGLTWLKPIVDASPALTGALTGYLPTIVLAVFMSLLPAILGCTCP